MAEVEIRQIFYDEASKKNCAWHTYDNTGKLTHFFENAVIKELVEKGIKGDYFGVFSHKIQQKTIFKEKIDGVFYKLTPESLEKAVNFYNKDFFAFEKRRQSENVFEWAELYQPGLVDRAKKILNEIGYDYPKKTHKIVLLNHFVARKSVYEDYVNEMLIPAMKVCDQMPEIQDPCRYNKTPYDFTPYLGYNHYPFTPFILERFPSVWLEKNKKVTFKHIF